MADTLNERVGVLTRREIEARILKPFVDRVGAELGEERTRELLQQIVLEAARATGEAMCGDSDDLETFATCWEPWFRGGALEVEEITRSPREWRFNVTHCRYADLYRRLGMADALPSGPSLALGNRDAALIEGFSERATLTRTQTIMNGASHCDFHYKWSGAEEDD